MNSEQKARKWASQHTSSSHTIMAAQMILTFMPQYKEREILPKIYLYVMST